MSDTTPVPSKEMTYPGEYPERIYLNRSEDCESENCWELHPETSWCGEKINDGDVEYVRADLARRAHEPPDELSSHDLESLKQCAQGWHAVFGDLMHSIPDFWDAPVDTEKKTGIDRVRMHIRRLLERASQPPVPEWQPIETAPKDDGFECIIAAPGWYPKHNHCLVGEARRYEEHWYWAQLNPSDGEPVYPTHWMPLPSPPTKGEG